MQGLHGARAEPVFEKSAFRFSWKAVFLSRAAALQALAPNAR
jgi:hypothetical protein